MQRDWPICDSHLHLQSRRFAADLPAVLLRARAVGVRRLVVAATCPADWDAVAALADAHDYVQPGFGVHPWYMDRLPADWLAQLEARLRARPDAVVAEIGVDRMRPPPDEAEQQRVFEAQLALAARLDRPAVVHCLKAWGRLHDTLRHAELPARGVVLHAYGGSAELARQLARLGCWFSAAPNSLDTRRRKARQAMQAVPRERLLVETDAPDLPPPPSYRGCFSEPERNEPCVLPALIEGLAELRGDDPDELADALWQNAERVFGMPRQAITSPA